MSADFFHSSLLGLPLRMSLAWRNGSTPIEISLVRPVLGIAGKVVQFLLQFHFIGRFSSFSSRKIGFLSDGFRVNCFRESFPNIKALIRLLKPPWKEGLFFIRCLVFIASLPWQEC